MSSKIVYTSKYRKTWALGDIHGGLLALEQVLERSGFDNENDLLLFAGDVADGWPETNQCIERLMQIKNLVHVLGNHDDWTISFYDGKMDRRFSGDYSSWIYQGGQATVDSYPEGKMPAEHLEFLKSAVHYCEIAENEGDVPTRIITHGGFAYHRPVAEQNTSMFCWNRELITLAFTKRSEGVNLSKVYDEIYVGHTPTMSFDMQYVNPVNWSGVWNIDTSAAYSGKLSMIDINTKEFFQSDVVKTLYPDHPGRTGTSYNEEKRINEETKTKSQKG